MAQQTIDIGTVADDGTGDTYRDAFDKSNDNFDEIYTKSVVDNDVTINQLSDFPAAVAGVITLEDGKHYHLGADVTSTSRFVLGKNNRFSWSESGPLLTYSGTGVMFTGTDVEFSDFFSCRMTCPTASKIWDVTDTVANTSIFAVNKVSVIAAGAVGTFTELASVLFNSSAVFSCTNGITLVGGTGTPITVFSIDKLALASTSATFKGVDFGNKQYSVIEINDFLVANTTAGAFAISGLVSSGNVPAGSMAQVNGCEFINMATPLENITVSDLQWEFQNNSGLDNSSKAVDTFLTSAETVTISVAGTFVAINGTNWSSDVSERYTTTTAGLVTYDSPVDSKSLVISTVTVEKVGGGADEIEVKIALNGTVVDKTVSSTQNANPTSVTSQGIFTLTATDTIQLFVANIDSTANIEVHSATMTIINGF